MWFCFFNEVFNTSIYEIVSTCEQHHSVDLCFLSEGQLVELKGFSLFFCEWAESKAKACWISSLLSVVSKSPGVSTTVTGRPQASPLSIWHVLVTWCLGNRHHSGPRLKHVTSQDGVPCCTFSHSSFSNQDPHTLQALLGAQCGCQITNTNVLTH